MALFNTKIEFIASGRIKANVDTILFEDTYLTGTLAVAEEGHADLDVRFVSNSILGALNELLDGLVETSGSISTSVLCYTEAVDTALFLHTLTHGLGTFDLMVQMYDANPASGPVAVNVIAAFTPIDLNTVQIDLDAAASGHFVVFGCP